MSMARLVAGATAAMALSFAVPSQAAVDINGGLSWGGWTSVGLSNQLGVYGSGSSTSVYEVYTTSFAFNGNSVSGGGLGGGPTGGATGFGTGAFSSGAFGTGNIILGIGVRAVSGDSITGFTPTIRFDLDGDSYQAATSVGGGDGRTSFTSWSETGDFTAQFEGANAWRGGTLTMQAGNGTSNGGPDNQQWLVGGIGSGVSYDFAFRAFAQSSSYQSFFDLGAMQSLYGVSNPFGKNANFTGIGTPGNPIRISLNGMGTNNVVFDANTTLTAGAVPEPATWGLMILGFGVIGGAMRRRRAGAVRVAHA
jgi:hypothetical protein